MGEDRTEAPSRDTATPTSLKPWGQAPPRSSQDRFHILTPHPSAHLEGTRVLRFWREAHQVRSGKLTRQWAGASPTSGDDGSGGNRQKPRAISLRC